MFFTVCFLLFLMPLKDNKMTTMYKIFKILGFGFLTALNNNSKVQKLALPYW